METIASNFSKLQNIYDFPDHESGTLNRHLSKLVSNSTYETDVYKRFIYHYYLGPLQWSKVRAKNWGTDRNPI